MTPIEAFLDPLAQWARHHPNIEARVFWFLADTWTDMDADPLDAEEIAFYAEGLLLEGFGMIWEILGQTGGGPQSARLLFWQGPRPPLPATAAVLQSDAWAGAWAGEGPGR